MKIFLCALSDPLSEESVFQLENLACTLEKLGIECKGMQTLMTEDPRQKAQIFNEAVRSGQYDWIFDVSGGNLANLCLPYLDYGAYRNSYCLFAGYSDLSCILNALYTKTGRPSLLYALYYTSDLSILTDLLFSEKKQLQYKKERSHRKENKAFSGIDFYSPDGRKVILPESAVYAGGNLRCFLKLAGTEYFPDLKNKWLIVEGMGTGKEEFLSLMMQLKCMGVFEEISGIVFGVFSRILSSMNPEDYPRFLERSLEELQIHLPWVYTYQIGHLENEKPILLYASQQDPE